LPTFTFRKKGIQIWHEMCCNI